MKNRYLIGSLLILILVAAIGCGAVAEPAVKAPANQGEVIAAELPVQEAREAASSTEAVNDVNVEVVETETADAELEPVNPVAADSSEHQPDVGSETETKDEAEAQESAVEAKATGPDAVENDVNSPVVAAAADFIATTGLDQFTSYRLNFATSFDGTRGGQPTDGSLGGSFEVTKEPQAQHWQVIMDGDAFQQLAILGGKMELYDLGDKIFIQNPQDGSWLGVPAMFVDSFLPADMVTPEDSIELPLTATLLPGQEMVNGILTQRYTFGAADLAGDSSRYDSVEGTIWVAVEGNYVVRYEAIVVGRHDNLDVGGIELIDEGTIKMMYDINDMNGDFTIEAPEGALDISLGDLFK